MIKKLQQIYPSIIPFDASKSEHFHWFISETGEIFGIHQKELTPKDLQLLQTFFKKYQPNLPEKTALEQIWHERIFEENNHVPTNSFRFIYFDMQKNQIDPITFQEALATLFDHELPVLWESETDGIMIEEIQITEEEIHFEQIINILMADVSVNIRFFVGPIIHDFTNTLEEFSNLIKIGRNVFHSTQQKVIHYIEAVPYLILKQLSEEERTKLQQSILKKFSDDAEMLETLHMYFKHNLNISETAKHMYMHRNSLQYRIDKFTKETGIHVQSFNDALTVKLALLTKNGLAD